uniref:Gamma-tubulin complex component n=1 Tax=Angiostrongylus cantonensis TaxID=6313 RepID=A0A0K0DDX1_ANGCA
MSLNTTSTEFATATKLNGYAFVTDLQWLLTISEERFLLDTSKWVLEILAYCPATWVNEFADASEEGLGTSSADDIPHSAKSASINLSNRNLLFGKNLLMNRDFARASFFLRKTVLLGYVERFLYYWSKYLGCVRTRLENEAEAIDRKAVENTDDRDMAELLSEIGRESRPLDMFLLYLLVFQYLGLRKLCEKMYACFLKLSYA